MLWKAFSWHVVAIVLATFVAYVAWTVRMTGYSADLRKIANAMDGETTGKAVDALLNYETVSVFGNVRMESKQYDGLCAPTTRLRSGRSAPRARSTRGKP